MQHNFPPAACGVNSFHIMAAISIDRQWHSTQPMNTELRGWLNLYIKTEKMTMILILYMKLWQTLLFDMMKLVNSLLIYSCETHAALKNPFSTTQAIRHFKMTVYYTQIIQFNSIPHVCCQWDFSYFMFLYNILEVDFSEQYGLVQYL